MNGCHNRAPYTRVTPAADGYFMDGYTRTPRMVAMPFRMSPECNYTETELGQADKQCQGCKWRANGQADTGVAVVGKPEPVGSGVVGIRDGQGAEAGESGAGGLQQSAGVAEEQGVGEQARAAEELEAKYPNSAIYRRAE